MPSDMNASGSQHDDRGRKNKILDTRKVHEMSGTVNIEQVKLAECYDRWLPMSEALERDMFEISNFGMCPEIDSRKYWENRLENEGVHFCAFIGSEAMMEYTVEPEIVYIHQLYVVPESRCQGLGSRLVEHVRKYRLPIFLCVVGGNERALGFYERHGFRIKAYSMQTIP
jgi:ribosomal protein S18 acetylase RimI-like enzyme